MCFPKRYVHSSGITLCCGTREVRCNLGKPRSYEIVRLKGVCEYFWWGEYHWLLFSILSHRIWLMSSSELNAGTPSEYQPSLYVIHSPEGGSISDVTSEHTRSQSITNTGISTADNRKGNDEMKSGSSVTAVREKGSSKNRAISTPRPLQKTLKLQKSASIQPKTSL